MPGMARQYQRHKAYGPCFLLPGGCYRRREETGSKDKARIKQG